MPFDPNIDVGGPARFMLGGFNAGASAGASRRHLDINQADLAMRQQDFARQQAEQAASDEVWRAVADYAMKGLTVEDFVADHMPNSDLGRRALAMGKGTGGTGMPVGAGSVLAPGAQEWQPSADYMGAPGMTPPGVGAGTVLADPGVTTSAPGSVPATAGAMAPQPPHPDDERMRRALQLAPAHVIQQVMPHLQDERKRRALTGTLNYLIDQGLQDNVVTPHLQQIIGYYAQAGEPDYAIHALAQAYEQHGKHQDAMALEQLRQQGRLDVADVNAGSRESIAADKEKGVNERFDRGQTEKERAAQVKEDQGQQRLDQGQQKIDESKYVHDKAIEQRQTRLDQLQQAIDNPKKGSVASDETVYMANKEIGDLDRHHANLFNRRNALAKERDGLPPVGMKDKEWAARQKELSSNIKQMDRDLEDLEEQRRSLEGMRDTAIKAHRQQTAKPVTRTTPSKVDDAADALIDEALGIKK